MSLSSHPRGIRNATETACHINAALVLMGHVLHPPTDNASLLDCALLLRDRTDTAPLDPSAWYNNPCFASQSAEELGDAVEALRRLLSHSTAGRSSPPSLQASWETVFTCGARTNVLRCRSIPNPYPLSIKDASCILEALRTAWSESEVVDGYQWGDDTVDSAITTRHRRIHSLPSILLLHLQQFEYDTSARQVVPRTESCRHIDIPISWETSELHLDDRPLQRHVSYSLTGGIIHISESNDLPKEEEDGHYATLILHHDQWFLIDDERVREVTADQATLWLEGGPWDSDASSDDATPFSRAVLLVYDSDPETTHALWKEAEDNNQPAIGRRISVRWKSGRYFSGTITSYNEETKKYTVLYDDGDVREYNLATKTYVWVQ